MGLAVLMKASKTLRLVDEKSITSHRSTCGRVPRFDGAVFYEKRKAAMKHDTTTMSEAVETTRQPAMEAGQGAPGKSVVPSAPKLGFWGRIVEVAANLVPGVSSGRRSNRKTGLHGGKLVQQELKLENVRVCRNDLSGDDWVIPSEVTGARRAFLSRLVRTEGSPMRGGRIASRHTTAERV